ncbi:MAG: BtaA family protein [Fibrobacterales bacterium]
MEESIENRAAFDIIRYANCWEDTEVLLKGMNIVPGDICYSIAAAGDNSLAMLTKDPAKVIAFDLSIAQIALVELKKIGFKKLEYPELLTLLGVTGRPEERIALYNGIQSNLSQESKIFWESRLQDIAQGVIYTGKFEKYFKLFREKFLPFVHTKKTIQKLLEKKSFDEQENFYAKKWNTWRWRLMFKVFFSKWLMGKAGRDKEFFKYVVDDVPSNIHRRVAHALTKISCHQNSYLNFILTGSYNGVLPYYLRKEYFTKIKTNIDNLEIHQATSSEVFKKVSGTFDAINLSDIFEYMNPELFKRVADEILDNANSGARLVYWNMMVPRKVSELYPERVQCDEMLSDSLLSVDNAFFYQKLYVDTVKRVCV